MFPLLRLGMLVALCFTGIALSNVFAQNPPGKKYAVLVGVNEYDSAQFEQLRWAVNDAVELGALLLAQGYEVKVLHSGAAGAGMTPTGANIQARLAEVLRRCKRHDTVLVALAGHGVQLEKQLPTDPDDAYFCPQDARIAVGQRGTLVSLRKLYQELDESGAGVKLLVVDACRNLAKLPRGVKRSLDGAAAVVPPRGVAALFSCSAGESAYESKELKHGVFFHVLLEGLRGKAAIDGEVTWDVLQQYVRRRVTREVAKLVGDPEAKQTPALNCIELAGEPPVLAKVLDTVEKKTTTIVKSSASPRVQTPFAFSNLSDVKRWFGPRGKMQAVLIADNKDPRYNNLNHSIEADLHQVTKLLGLLQRDGLVSQVETITSKDVTKEQILNRIRRIAVGANDTLFVYYVGYGKQDKGLKDQPDLGHYFNLLLNNNDVADNRLYRSEVVAAMNERGGRLKVLITDISASSKERLAKTGAPSESKRAIPADRDAFAEGEPLEENKIFVHLFMEHRGWVNINSCNMGETVFCEVFTPIMVNEMLRWQGEGQPSWPSFFEVVKKKTQKKTQVFLDLSN